MTIRQRRHARPLISWAALAAALAGAAPAWAQTSSQEAPADQTAGDESREILVTGTRIQRPGLVSASPITAIDSREIQFQGATAVENVLNRMPQVTADANENVSNGSDGTARINLRNLGSNRNLVLVNGQRLLPVQATDVNFIPSALVERIDVVTGGASAVYGSDAISGVVNFILRTDLNGIRADAQYGFSMHSNTNDFARDIVGANGYARSPLLPIDGNKFDANIAFGTNFAEDRGNLTAYFGYRETRPILQSNRDVSACAFDPAGAGNSTLTCGGSSNNEYGLFQPLDGPNAGTRFNNSRDGERVWVPYDNSFRYNTAPLNYFQRSDVRYTAGAFARFEAAPEAELYGSFMFMDDQTFSQVAPSALWQGTTFTINCDNPLLSAQQSQLLCGSAAGTATTQDAFIGYRPVAGNARPRRDDLRHTDYRLTGGVRGQIAEGIRYDVSGLYSVVLFNENYQNDIDPAKANRALNVVNVNGTPTCQSVVDGTDPSCVPLDAFRYNGISDAAFDYIYAPTFTRGVDKETVLTGTVSGDLTSYGVTSPWADQGLGIVLGAEYRRESLDFRADALAQAKGTVESQGNFHVAELFTEVSVPIVENRPFAHALVLTGGYRLSDYSNLDKSVSTYKAEISYAPVRDLRLRGSYNRAIRAANISELFAPQQLGNVSAQDPCSGPTPTASLERCALTGVTAAQYGRIPECPAEVCVAQGGGNPALRPEVADTYTAGFVFSPSFLRRFSLTVDYFNIKVRDYIASVPASLIISQCFASGDPYFCNLFSRDPRNGVLFGENGYVRSTTQNTGSLKTSGIDVAADYSFDIDRVGRFNLGFVGTWLKELVNEPLPGLGAYDCKGLFGPTCGQPSPGWRHQARLTYTDPDNWMSLSLNWRYIGPTSLTNNTDDPFLTGTPYIINSRIEAYHYFDLAMTAKVHKGITLRAGVNNLFDADPPVIAQGLLSSFGNGNTYPGVYDVAGRSPFIGFTAAF